jgi:hypothetical protein
MDTRRPMDAREVLNILMSATNMDAEHVGGELEAFDEATERGDHRVANSSIAVLRQMILMDGLRRKLHAIAQQMEDDSNDSWTDVWSLEDGHASVDDVLVDFWYYLTRQLVDNGRLSKVTVNNFE